MRPMGIRIRAMLLAAVVGATSGSGCADPKSPQLLVGRIWVDHLPTKDTEHFEMFVALTDDPIGIFQRRSMYEGSFALFKYELRGSDTVQLLFPQDKSKHDVRYKARTCDVKDYDYCLDLDGAPRGAKSYLSRKEWEIDAKDLASLDAKVERWKASLRVDKSE